MEWAYPSIPLLGTAKNPRYYISNRHKKKKRRMETGKWVWGTVRCWVPWDFFMPPMQLLWILENTNEHRKKVPQKHYSLLPKDWLQHVQLPQQQILCSCKQMFLHRMGPRRYSGKCTQWPKYPLKWFCSQVPPVRHFPVTDFPKICSQLHSDFSEILWDWLSVLGSLHGALWLSLEDNACSLYLILLCYFQVLFDINQSVIKALLQL